LNVWLIGMMGAGKSAAGERLAQMLEWDYVDTDELIEAEAGFSIADLFEFEGEDGFRQRESQAVARLAREKGHVIATGGGAVLNAENRRLMRESGSVVWLEAAPATIVSRLANDPAVRPLAEDPAAIARLHRERRSTYEAAATFAVGTDDLSVDETAAAIMALL
jgi:shikimate kinase